MTDNSERSYRFVQFDGSGESLKCFASLLAGVPAEGVDVDTFEISSPLKIIRHCADQANKAASASDFRPQWAQLSSLIDAAMHDWDNGDPSRVCEAFFCLGQLSGELSMPPLEEYLEGLKARESQARRSLPLRRRNIAAACCKEAMQEVAKIEWEHDVTKSIRLSDMCEIIWAKVMNHGLDADFLEALPDKASGLKPWIRPVAPGYARRGGAPKKK
jgi:hypothetical protein